MRSPTGGESERLGGVPLPLSQHGVPTYDQAKAAILGKPVFLSNGFLKTTMPIYEFYCRDCHTIFSFFARRVDTETVPKCPKSKRHKLQRQMSRFAISKGRGDAPPDNAPPEMDIDDERMEQAMMQMAGEMENVSEDDPRAMARMMRKLMDTTGMNMGAGMEEAIRRMEAGEDPDKVEEELGDVLDGEDPFSSGEGKLRGLRRRLTEAPNVDPNVYDM